MVTRAGRHLAQGYGSTGRKVPWEARRFSVPLGGVVDGGSRTKEAIVKVNQRTRSGDELLGRYIDALHRYGEPEPDRSELAPGYDVRTCTHCGAHVIFLIDPRGGWADCDACGRAA
jgi:hypothetical protein